MDCYNPDTELYEFTIIHLKCDECGYEWEHQEDKYYDYDRPALPDRCPSCDAEDIWRSKGYYE